MTQNKKKVLEGARLKTSLPISLFPAVPYSSQIDLISTGIKKIVITKDLTQISFLNTLIKNFREQKYNEIFSSEFRIKKTRLNYYKESFLGLLHLSSSTNEIFSKENYPVLKFINEELQSSQLTWFFIITSDDTLVFSLTYNHFLSWSTLLKNHEGMFICLSLMDPSILELIDDESRIKAYKKSLLTVNQLFTVINEKKITETINKDLTQSLEELLKFDNFENSHNYLKSYFEDFLKYSYDFHAKKGLIDILTNLEKQSDSEIVDKLKIIDLLDISPINFLEVTPFIMNDKLRGQYYTPLELTIPLIINTFHHKTSIEDINSLKILDPACGTGILLVVAVEYIVNKKLLENSNESFLKMRKSVFDANVTGMDIDERLVHYCKSFFALFLNSRSILSESDTPIVHNNFLEVFVHNHTKNPLKIQKYDLIISNPPYIPLHSRFMKNVLSDELKKELKRIIPSFIGKRDNLYIMFFGLALEKLTKSNHGTVSFLMDSSFLDLPSYENIRKHLLSQYNLQYILSQYKYDRAVVDLSIVSFENSKKRVDSYLWHKNISQSPVQRKIKDLLEQPNFSYSIQLDPKIQEIIRTIQERSVLLEDISDVSCGLEYGSLLRTHFLSPVKKPDYFKVIDGANGLPQSYVLFWVPNWRNSYVRVSKEYENHLKLNQLNKSPKANKEVLLISGSKDRFIEPKIIVRQTASRFIATYDEEGYFGLRNLHIIHSFDKQYSPLLILGILSSKLGTTLGKALNIIRGSGNSTNRYPQIRIGDLKRFPIIDLSQFTKYNLELIKKLVELVSKNLNDAKALTDIYYDIWSKFFDVSGNIPVSSQKRFFQLLDSPKKLSFLSKEISEDIAPLLKDLRKQKDLLIQNQNKIDEKVIKIYNLTKDTWYELSVEIEG